MSIISRTHKEFVVMAQSTNTNSFGLREHVLVARDGEAHKICLSDFRGAPTGSVVVAEVVKFDTGQVRTDFHDAELPQRLAPAPADVVASAWARQLAS
jgi:hypothetical protein